MSEGQSGPGLCFVGCGAIAARHARALRGRASLFFHSRSRRSAEALNDAHAGSGIFEAFEAALRDERVTAVVITSPPEHHAAQTLAALEAGKHVLVEKPAYVTPEEGTQIGEAAAARPGRVLMVAENYYYKPSLAVIREWLREGVIGTVKQARIRKCTKQEATGWKAGHGALLEGGVHFVALATALFGTPERVTARFPTVSGDEPERHSIVTLAYDAGPTVELTYAWDAPSLLKGTFQHAAIEGDAGRIGFECNGIYAWLRGKRRAFRFPGFGDLMGYGAMMDDFLACVSAPDARAPVSDFARARRDLEVVFRAYACRSGKR